MCHHDSPSFWNSDKPFFCQFYIFEMLIGLLKMPKNLKMIFFQFSALLLFPLAGVLCWSTLGWHSVHYIFAGCEFFSNSSYFVFQSNSSYNSSYFKVSKYVVMPTYFCNKTITRSYQYRILHRLS